MQCIEGFETIHIHDVIGSTKRGPQLMAHLTGSALPRCEDVIIPEPVKEEQIEAA